MYPSYHCSIFYFCKGIIAQIKLVGNSSNILGLICFMLLGSALTVVLVFSKNNTGVVQIQIKTTY
jgi:hypothetical protein